MFLALCVISAVEMFSASSTLAFKAESHIDPAMRHMKFLAMGIVIAFVVHLFSTPYIRLFGYVLMLLSIVFLIMVIFVGVTENDATRWLVIAGIRFQPSELAKLSLIIVIADLISRINKQKDNEKKIFQYMMVLTAFISALILRDNFSTAVLLFAVVYIMMFIAHVSNKKLFIVVLAVVAAISIGFVANEILPEQRKPSIINRFETVKQRMVRVFNPSEDIVNKYEIRDANRQEQNAKIAIARGGAIGVFPGNSVQRDYLPQAYSDFIYAIIVEEMGLVGGVLMIIFYMILLYRAGRIATKSRTIFPAIVVIGLALMIVFQAFVNMAVSTSLIPVTGQPMPMVSRGGTSILITSVYFGIILGITRQIKNETIMQEEPITEIILEDEDD